MAKDTWVLEIQTSQMHCSDRRVKGTLLLSAHHRQKDLHLACYRFHIDELWPAHMVPAASLKRSCLRRDLLRVSKRLGGDPGGWGTASHPDWGEDCRDLVITLASPLRVEGPGEAILFKATMVESQWPEPPPKSPVWRARDSNGRGGNMYSRPLNQSTWRGLPSNAIGSRRREKNASTLFSRVANRSTVVTLMSRDHSVEHSKW